MCLRPSLLSSAAMFPTVSAVMGRGSLKSGLLRPVLRSVLHSAASAAAASSAACLAASSSAACLAAASSASLQTGMAMRNWPDLQHERRIHSTV